MLYVLGHRTTLAKFQTKVKSSMKVYNVRLLAKIMINEHICQFLLINFVNIMAKTIKYQESLNSNSSKTVCPIWLKFK